MRDVARAHEHVESLLDPAAQRGRIQRGLRDSRLRRLICAGDAIAIVLSLAFALVISQRPAAGQRMLWGLAAVPLMLVLFKVYGLYDRDMKRISYSTVDDLPWLFHATVVGVLIFWLYSRFSPMQQLDLIEILVFGIDLIVLAAVFRYWIRRATPTVIGSERAVLVGTDPMSRTLVRKLTTHPEYQLELVGALTHDGEEETSAAGACDILGTIDDLPRIATRHDVSRVIVSARDVEESQLEDLLRRCRTLSLKVSVLPRLSDVLGTAVAVDDVEGITVLGLNPPWLPRTSRAIKRVMDIAIALVLLGLSSPLLLLVAIAIKLDSRGPVFFRQERVGRGGRRFRLIKFRTMAVDAEIRRAELLADSADANWLLIEHDPRITRLGRRLRRLSLDELPQLWNVLRGEMSMVGPRPLIPVEDERVLGWARGRLDLTPGITGYWQVLGRTRIPFDEMVKLDYLYVMNWSLWEDVRLMLKTLPVVLAGDGAN